MVFTKETTKANVRVGATPLPTPIQKVGLVATYSHVVFCC